MITDVEIEKRLREAFAARADRTLVSEHRSTSTTSRVVSESTGRRWTPLVGVAAASVVLVGGLFVVRALTSEAPSPADTVPPASIVPVVVPVVVIDDRRAIDLDAWQPLPEAGDSGLSFVVLDTDQLPDGYALIDANASTFLGGPVDGPFYVSTNRINLADDRDIVVSTEAYEFAPCALLDSIEAPQSEEPDEATDPADVAEPAISVNGVEASVVAGSLCWKQEPDVYASVRFDGRSSGEFTTDEIEQLVDVAAELRFTEVDRLPPSSRVERPPDAVELAPDDPDFAGRLGGMAWSADASDTSLRGMQIYIDGKAASGFEHDRSSQPNDVPAATGHVTIAGTPGAGAMVSGYVMPEAANVILRSVEETVSLPLLRRQFESYFVFPVPKGVVIESVEFTNDVGAAIAMLELPYLPSQLGGSYGGGVEIERL